ncbi:hypothetical protein TWF281_006245 [Arthrobotrys megalospora]
MDGAAEKPQVLLLNIGQELRCTSILGLIFLSTKVELITEREADTAIQYLEQNRPAAVIVLDDSLTYTCNVSVLEAVLNYVRNGGTLIICYFEYFPSATDMIRFNRFFARELGLPWTRGSNFFDYYVGINNSANFPPAPTRRRTSRVDTE